MTPLALARSGILLPGQVRPCAPKQIAVPNGLVGYWGLDADCLDFTNSLALDLSGNGGTGTLVASPTLAQGKIGNALSLNGTTQYVSLGASTAYQPVAAGTYSAWINPVGLSNRVMIGGSNFSLDRNGMTLYLDGSAIVTLELANASARSIIHGLTSMSAGAWWFAAATWNGSVVNIFLNGKLDLSAAQTLTPTNGVVPTRIGTGADAVAFSFSGLIDDVRIYNRALDPWEMIQLYQAGLAGRRDAGNMLSPLNSASVM